MDFIIFLKNDPLMLSFAVIGSILVVILLYILWILRP